jgi:hypothetical protein
MAKDNKNQINVKNIFDLFLIIKINYKFFFLFFFTSFFSLYYFTSTKNLKYNDTIVNIHINNPYSQTDTYFYDILELINPKNNNEKDISASPIRAYYDFFADAATKNYSQNFNLNDFTFTKNEPNDSSYLSVKYNKKITSINEYETYISFVSNNLIRELNLFAFNVSYGILVNNLNTTNTRISALNLISENNINNNTFFLAEFINIKQKLEVLKKMENNFLILKKNKNYPQIYRIDIKYSNNNYSFGFIIFSSVSIATLLTFLLFYFIEAFKNQRN